MARGKLLSARHGVESTGTWRYFDTTFEESFELAVLLVPPEIAESGLCHVDASAGLDIGVASIGLRPDVAPEGLDTGVAPIRLGPGVAPEGGLDTGVAPIRLGPGVAPEGGLDTGVAPIRLGSGVAPEEGHWSSSYKTWPWTS